MSVVQAQNLQKSYGDREIFSGINFSVEPGERIGLVGINGSGKTTLLKCLAGEILPDQGEISRAKSLKLAYLEQLFDQEETSTAWDIIMDSFSALTELRSKIRQLETEISQGGDQLNSLLDRYARYTEEYDRANGYACENMARRILTGLGFTEEQYQQPASLFSGGQKTRLNLAAILAKNPDLLLLDEPTNHLDIRSAEWLENYLISYRGTVIVVSHDRTFLNQIATRIVELDNKKLYSYPGNFDNYVQLKAENNLAWQRAYEKQQKQIEKTREYISKYKAGVKSRQARGRQAQLDRLEKIKAPPSGKTITSLNLTAQQESGQEVLRLEGICKAFGHLQIFNQADLMLRKGDKIALIGPNGSGKTTLLKMITGLVAPDQGQVVIGSRVRLGYFSQEYEDLNEENTLLDELVYNFEITLEKARSLLGRMLFTGDTVYKQVKDLSGGEKGRLSLLKVFLTGANFLIMDEPTNHLDIESRQVVEDMLAEFSGTVLLVSHDRYFIDQVVTAVVAIEDKKLRYYWGDYSYYRGKQESDKIITASNQAKVKEMTTNQLMRQKQKEQQKEQRRLTNTIQELEEKIAHLEEKKSQLEELLSAADTYTDETRAQKYIEQYETTRHNIDSSYIEWELLYQQLEQISCDE